jgi:hypothetical protein
VAQVGRISGPLLTANLERNGIDLKFKDTLDQTSLLYFDVANNRIGVNTDTVTEVDLQTIGTTRTTNLITDEARKGNINFSNNNINVSFGDLNFNAQEAIQASTLETDQYFINDNYISTKNSNANIDLVPNGTGRLIVGAADSTGDRALNVRGDLHATGDITFEGNIIFGDDSTVDTVTFDADIKSDIIPDAHWTFNIGSAAKRWRYLSTELVNGEDVYTSALAVNGVNIEQRVGNIFYVSVNGDDTNTGDHVQDPFKTIKHALAQCDPSTTGPVEIVVFPGDYQEELPLEVPSNVTVTGADIRNTIIRPDTSSQSEDVFLMNGESTVQHLTIKDFFYDSINDKGYAFRFAPNTTVTSRSPYIQNVTVITQGSTITADDPRGFASGDAGKGALVDGSDVVNNGIDASMLFHSVTFITPGVDALTMTNGVKVEWLNSFTYFANRGLYAVNGATGHLSSDGSTTLFGAEVRSIGSANVYGNYGAVADGNDCLMYLVMHNFGYIGAGKLVDNDNYNYIQANEVVELNSGVIRYQSTNHQGNFRVGDNFLVDFETGSTTLDISTVETDSFAGISITTGPNSTLITGDTFEVGNFNIRDNEIDSLVGDINIDAATNVTNIASNVLADGDLAITGSFSYGGDLEIGDTPVDTIDFNVEFTQDLNPNTTETYSLGTETSAWKNIRLGAANIGDIQINDNYITTDVSNADLELRASGTGIIQVPNSLTAEQDFTANGTTTFIQDVTVYGTLSLIGDNEATAFRLDSYERLFRSNTPIENTRRRQFRVDSSGLRFALGYSNNNLAPTYAIGDYIAIAEAATPDTYLAIIKILSLDSANTVNSFASNLVWNIEIIEGNLTSFVDRDEYIVKVSEINTFSDDFNLEGNFSVGQNLTVGLDGVFETISLKGNVITTEVSNSDLELRANGVGNVVIPYSDTVIENNIEINGTTYSSDWNVATQVEAVTLTNDTIDITNNEIKTVISNANLDLTAAPNGIIDISNNNVVAGQDFSVSGLTTILGTNITGTLIHTGNRTQTGNTIITGNLSTDNFTLDRNIQLENIEITGNLIHTTVTNSDLDFRANGTGRVIIEEDLHVTQNVNIGTLTANVINIAQDVDLNEIIIDGTVELDENVITTTDSNADLELRASGTGIVNVATNDVEIDNALTVNGVTDINDTNITGILNRTGNTTQTGNVLITGTVTLDGQIAVDRGIDLEEISIDTNVITTTTTNANLELRAAGTGLIRLEDVQVNNNFSAGSLNDVQSITVQNTVQLDTIDLSTDIQLTENVITTTNSNSNLELRANGTGDVLIENNLFANNNILGTKQGILTVDLQTESATITSTNSIVLPNGTTAKKIGTTAGLRFNTDTNLIGGQGSIDTINFGGVYSSDGLTGISVTSSDDIQIFVDGYSQDSTNKVGEITGDGVRLHGLQVDDILFDQNEIGTNVSNSNLDIVTNGTGSITIDDFTLKGNTISVPADTNIEFKTSGDSFRWVEFEGDKAIKWPAGPASSRPANPVLGLTRVNTDTGELETWVGDQWRTSAGEFASISEADMEEEAFIQTLIYG